MIAKARHPVNYNGAWHASGETFEIDAADAEMMEQFAEIINADEHVNHPEPEQAQRRGRRRRYGEGKDEEE